MTYKIVDTREKHTMSKRQEDAIMNAFDRFEPQGTHLKAPQREHLGGEFVPGLCCKHDWTPVNPLGFFLTPDGKAKLQQIFEETELGDQQKTCLKCGALSLWENGELFAYDAVAQIEQSESKGRKDNR